MPLACYRTTNRTLVRYHRFCFWYDATDRPSHDATGLPPHEATELLGTMPPFDATVLSSTKEMPRTKLPPYSHDATGLIIASVKTPPHVTLSIPMNHRCHGVMAGPLTSD